MWCCKFKENEWIVCSMRATQKGSIKATVSFLGVSGWKEAKNRGVRCFEVKIDEVIRCDDCGKDIPHHQLVQMGETSGGQKICRECFPNHSEMKY